TAPMTPRAMSRKNPSPVLLTILLAMKPEIRPRTIQASNDMTTSLSCPSQVNGQEQFLCQSARDASTRIRQHRCGPRASPTGRHAQAIEPPPAQNLHKKVQNSTPARPGPQARNEDFQQFSDGS